MNWGRGAAKAESCELREMKLVGGVCTSQGKEIR